LHAVEELLHLPNLPGSGSGDDELRTIAEKLSEMFDGGAKEYPVVAPIGSIGLTELKGPRRSEQSQEQLRA
jgi:hypothetical protein